MAYFALVVHELVIYFDFCIIPKFVVDLFIGLPKINFNCLKLSFIRNSVSYYFNLNKVHLTNCDSNINNSDISSDQKIMTILMKKDISSSKVSKNVTNYNNGEGSSRIDNQNNVDSLRANNERGSTINSFINEVSNTGFSNTSLELTPEKYNSKGDLLLSTQRPPVFDEKALRQTSSNSLLSQIPNNPGKPNPYENMSTPSLDSNSMGFPSIPVTPEINSNNVRFPFNNGVSSRPSIDTNNELITSKASSTNIKTDNNLIDYVNYSSNSSYTNDTNHATLGTTEYPYYIPTPDERNMEFRRQQIMSNHRRQIFENAMNDTVSDFTNLEVDVPKDGIRGKVKFGLRYLGSKVHNEFSKLDSMYIKYNDVSKRHFY
jgi:hypothetical protein